MKKLLFVFFMVFASLSLFACKGSEISAEQLRNELEGVSLKEEGVFEAGFNFNFNTEVNLGATNFKQTNSIESKIQSDLLNTIVNIKAKQTYNDELKESSAMIYKPEGEFVYVDAIGDFLESVGIGEGKFKVPFSNFEEGLPPVGDDLPIDPGMFESLEFLDKFKGIDFYKNNSTLTIKVNITKKVLLKNVDLIVNEINKTSNIPVTKEEFIETLNLLKDFLIKIEVKIVDKQIDSLSFQFKMVISQEEAAGTTISIDGKLNFKYISKMPAMPNFDDFVLTN